MSRVVGQLCTPSVPPAVAVGQKSELVYFLPLVNHKWQFRSFVNSDRDFLMMQDKEKSKRILESCDLTHGPRVG